MGTLDVVELDAMVIAGAIDRWIPTGDGAMLAIFEVEPIKPYK